MGAGIVIEKAFQPGGEMLRDRNPRRISGADQIMSVDGALCFAKATLHLFSTSRKG